MAAFDSRSSAQMSVGAQVMDCALVTGSAAINNTSDRGCNGMQAAITKAQICLQEDANTCVALVQNESKDDASLYVQYF